MRKAGRSCRKLPWFLQVRAKTNWFCFAMSRENHHAAENATAHFTKQNKPSSLRAVSNVLPRIRISTLDSSSREIRLGLLRKLENPLLRTNSDRGKRTFTYGNFWGTTAQQMPTATSSIVAKWFLWTAWEWSCCLLRTLAFAVHNTELWYTIAWITKETGPLKKSRRLVGNCKIEALAAKWTLLTTNPNFHNIITRGGNKAEKTKERCKRTLLSRDLGNDHIIKPPIFNNEVEWTMFKLVIHHMWQEHNTSKLKMLLRIGSLNKL